jgi:hypothetical protein
MITFARSMPNHDGIGTIIRTKPWCRANAQAVRCMRQRFEPSTDLDARKAGYRARIAAAENALAMNLWSGFVPVAHSLFGARHYQGHMVLIASVAVSPHSAGNRLIVEALDILEGEFASGDVGADLLE